MIIKLRNIYDISEKFGLKEAVLSTRPFFNDKFGGSIIRQRWYEYKYGNAAAKPDTLINIDPNEIEYKIVPHFKRIFSNQGYHIIPGDWDQKILSEERPFGTHYNETVKSRHLVPFDETIIHKSFKERFVGNTCWQNTEFYQYMIDRINSGQKPFRYETKHQLERRLDKIDRLYEDIKYNGYQKQKDLVHRTDSPLKEDTVYPPRNEVVINIGRAGEIIFDDGHHRFSISKILNVDQIPAKVLCRHSEWQKRRCELASANSKKEVSNEAAAVINHPDMTDVVSFT